MKSKTILFAGGGTGGHIAPLLSVMEAVQAQNSHVKCAYVGLKSDLESPLLAESELSFSRFSITSGKIHRHLTFDHISQAGKLLKGLWGAERLIRTLKPDLVFCKGSMVSVPIAQSAARHNIPLYSHESDVIPGLANRIISRYVTTIFTSFPTEEYRQLPQEKLLHTGQPVRSVFYRPNYEAQLVINGSSVGKNKPIITIIGGSQGAHRINTLMQSVWVPLLETTQIVQICGNRDGAELSKAREKLSSSQKSNLFVTEFESGQLPALLAQSTVVISRAGGTIFELAALEKPTILFPLSTAAQNHQWANAEVLKKTGAAIVLDELTITPEELLQTILTMLNDQKQRTNLGQAIGRFQNPDAASQMAGILLKRLVTGDKIG